jgi:SAM-dependent methyltransferase
VTAYDEVPYTGRPYADAHPERLATMAMLHGVKPAPVEHCRVLEVACGDAANLIPMAYALPQAEFMGFDVAAQPIEAGKRLASRIGLKNLSLAHLDLTAFPADAGTFDYIIAHGLYSWIPAPVREQLLALIARHLAPRGVAFVSYNVYPGCFVRRMVWEMLRFHVEPVEEPAQRIAEAQAFARLIAEGRTVHDAYTSLMKGELARFSARDAGFLFHDDLADVNDPCYFHEFVEHAAGHRLQFLCEAELVASAYTGLTAQLRQVLDSLDPLAREQYLDFAKCRRFRQTLLCHEGVDVDRNVSAQSIDGFRFLTRRHGIAEESVPPEAPQPEEQLARALLDALDAAAPRALSADELAERLAGSDRDYVGKLCLAAAQAGAVQLHTHVPELGTSLAGRPVASAVVRAQLAHGNAVTSLRHAVVDIDDDLTRRMLPLLDGTRDRDALAESLGEPRDAVDARLLHLAKLALLV